MSSVDFSANEAAHANLIVKDTHRLEEQGEVMLKTVGQHLGNSKLHGVLCVAGGWQGGSANSDTFLQSCDTMWRQSVWSSVISAQIATRFLAEDGSLVLVGASAAFSRTPKMVAYGLAKAAVHHLTRSLASEKGGLPRRAFVAAICPEALDTPANRSKMTPGQLDSCAPLELVATQIHHWVEGRERPPKGSLVRVLTIDGVTQFSLVDHI